MSQFISVSELKTHRNEYIVLDVRGVMYCMVKSIFQVLFA